MRLATHELCRRDLIEPPVLLLDDVFSELDAYRAAALVELLPPGQVLLTTAVDPRRWCRRAVWSRWSPAACPGPPAPRVLPLVRRDRPPPPSAPRRPAGPRGG